jgi:hypothetical protein
MVSEVLDDVSDPGLATLATVLAPVGLATYLSPRPSLAWHGVVCGCWPR